ncbi:MAG: bL27 family ribosomal protein [Candidatus Peribacteria bacterium]|jgi:large subunit ribosomal protein L27|nr:bL27 family ribosomal protein [Candidatus Peribacteria bacterium]
MAHKKAAGSAKNLRDSQPKYRGVKLFGGQKALAGNIIIRQKGSQYVAGQNTYLGADFTIHATIDGVVSFKKKNFKRFDGRTYLKTVVEIIPAEAVVAPKEVKKAEKIAPKIEKAPVEASEEAPKAEKAEKAPAKKAPAKKEKETAPKAEKKAPVKKPATKKAE